MNNPLFIDPPSGWMYGFPKQAPKNLDQMSQEEVNEWLIANGYAKEAVEYWVNSPKFGRVPYRLIGG